MIKNISQSQYLRKKKAYNSYSPPPTPLPAALPSMQGPASFRISVQASPSPAIFLQPLRCYTRICTWTRLSVTIHANWLCCLCILHLDEGFDWRVCEIPHPSTRSPALAQTFFKALKAEHQKDVWRKLYNDQRNPLFLIYSSIYFWPTCFGISYNPSSEEGVQFRQWFKSAGYGVTWLMRRSNRAFLSSHSLSKLHLVYVAGLNLITYICTLIDDNRKITRSSVAQPKFLISVFWARV
jgi:hypothetical protein